MGAGVSPPGHAARRRQFGVEVDIRLELRRGRALRVGGAEMPHRVAQRIAGRGAEAAVGAAVQNRIEIVQAVDGEGGSEYKTSYHNFSEDFTSNLKNSSALVQVSLACSTRYDGRVLMWLKKHELAIRSAILVVLADTPEEDAYTPEGKQRLAKRLADAINKVLTETEGFGGVDQVYFKGFLVQ